MGEMKYGYRYGPRCIIPGWPVGADEDFNHLGGNFCKPDGTSRRLEIAGDTHTDVVGWAIMSEEDASATEGATVCNVDVSTLSVYRIPINSGTYTHAMKGEHCDLSVASNMQGAQLDAHAEETLIICDGDNTAGWVDVRLNPNKIGLIGVGE